MVKDNSFIIPNMTEEASMLEWAGVKFGDDIIYILQKSLKRLATLSQASNLRLFGKIYGLQKDYWIVEGSLNFQEEPLTEDAEARGTGSNSNVYWVSDNLLKDWVQLPDVLPLQLEISRMMKY